MPYYTPLRYPGGKRRLASVVKTLLEVNKLKNVEYAEPYAGGAAIALELLMEEYASRVHINDLSRPVYAFWHVVLHDNAWLRKRLRNVRVNTTTWRRQRQIFRRHDSAPLEELGFAAFFLNRTNRSGIMSGGVIGGLDQAGEWKIDARFNKAVLDEQIARIGRYSSRISLTQLDACVFTRDVVAKLRGDAFAFFDPPYINKSEALYLNTYDMKGHRKVAAAVSRLRQPWVVTYDHAAVGAKLYPDARRIVYELAYTANATYAGREVMFVCDSLQLPSMSNLLDDTMKLVRHATRLRVA